MKEINVSIEYGGTIKFGIVLLFIIIFFRSFFQMMCMEVDGFM